MLTCGMTCYLVVISMGPRNAYKDMLDIVVSLITCVSKNHQNQLEQMANEAMFAIPNRSFRVHEWPHKVPKHQID
jgi:hypothetical protein